MIELGQLTATPRALDAMEQAGVDPAALLARHAIGDWGNVSREDWERNNACAEGVTGSLLSLYLVGEEHLWVYTEWDRSRTTVLMPDEY